MDTPNLLRAMTDAYVARRRKGVEFDDTAAIQAFWECQPQMSTAQTEAFAETGKGNSVAGWKVVLRGRLTADGPSPRRRQTASRW
jgi:hypothetical protein